MLFNERDMVCMHYIPIYLFSVYLKRTSWEIVVDLQEIVVDLQETVI